jgi:acetyltransferase-like isoleucine patch superfamily enzyme
MNKIYSSIGFLVFYVKKIFIFFEKKYIILRFLKSGNNLKIGNNCRFIGDISVADNVFIGSNCVFQSTHGKIIIGNNVMFGPGVHIHGGDHKIKYDKNNNRYEAHKSHLEDGSILIEDDVWIGANVIILKKVKIGKGSIIGAGTIVSFDVPPFSKVYGAKPLVLKKIDNE